MNYFLLFLIILLCGGGYYGYSTLESRIDGDQEQIAELKLKANNYDAEHQRLEQEYNDAKQEVAHMRMALVDMGQQVATTASAPKPAAVAAPAPDAPAAPPKPVIPPNKLGDIVAEDGKTYKDCKLLKVESDGIVVSHADGIMMLKFLQLPQKLRTRFGFDPKEGLELTDDQVDALEKQRLAAEDAGL